MAILGNTYQTYQAKAIREQLLNIIYNIAPAETPFISNCGTGEAANTFVEWQTDTLAAPSTSNQQIEGDNITSYDAVTPTVRLGNYTQISRKTVSVAGTEEVVNKAGRKSELAYQIAKKGMELKRDMEAGLLLPANIATVGATGTARITGGLPAWIKTNTDKGAAGVDPVYTNIPNNARTDGTLRAFTEIIFKNIIQLVWIAGGNPGTLMVGAVVKQEISAFAGVATKTFYMAQATTAAIIGAADVYVSDFGVITIVPNRFQRSRDAYLIDWNLLSVLYLRPFFQKPLAETGDAANRLMLVEFVLQSKNEAGLAAAYDVT